ncbi:MAG: hypothetical protein Kow0042_21210 [Calditrichia bacterium]
MRNQFSCAVHRILNEFSKKTGLWLLFICGILPLYSLEAAEDFYQQASVLLNNPLLVADSKCGFPVILQTVNSPNPELQQLYRLHKASAANLDRVYFSPSGHFRIHYALGGYHAIPTYDRDSNGIPDYLEFVGKSFDRAWEIEVDSLGFHPPPDSSGNPREVYPINCQHISNYGSTVLDYEIPNLPGSNYVTYIDINVNFSFVHYPGVTDPIVRDSMAIAVTAAHEFQHALHSGYRLYPDNANLFHDFWFIESSAVFMEEVVAPEVNDYIQYVKDYLPYINQPIDDDQFSSTAYGRGVFIILLGEIHGKDITRKIWEEILNVRATPAIEIVLNSLGSNLQTEIIRLSGWLYFSGTRAVLGKFFPDAALFTPDVSLKPANALRSSLAELTQDSLPRLSFQWYQSSNQTSAQNDILLKALPPALAEKLNLLVIDPLEPQYHVVNASQPFRLPSMNFGDNLAFSVVNGLTTGDELFPFNVLGRPQSAVLADVYPQPLKISGSQPFLYFENLPPQAEIHIFSSNGRHLRTIHPPANAVSAYWDLLTKFGEKVGSGVYLYHIVSADQERTGKFVVIR